MKNKIEVKEKKMSAVDKETKADVGSEMPMAKKGKGKMPVKAGKKRKWVKTSDGKMMC